MKLDEMKRIANSRTPGEWEMDYAVYPYEGPREGKQHRAIYARSASL